MSSAATDMRDVGGHRLHQANERIRRRAPPDHCAIRSSAMSKGSRPVYTTTTRMIIPRLFSKNRLARRAQELAGEFTCGQVTLAKLTFRSCWQQDSTAITGSIVDTHGPTRGFSMDAAHLSQTLYLVAAELRIRCLFHIVINGRDIEAHLGLDGIERGVSPSAGCGPRSATAVAAGARVRQLAARSSD